MADSYVEVTEGAGKKLHTNTRSVGGNTVHDEVVVLADPYHPTYSVVVESVSIDTIGTHLVQITAGASLKVRINSVEITAAAFPSADEFAFEIRRITTAGTGGTTTSVRGYDPADGAASCSAMAMVPTQGTEGEMLRFSRLSVAGASPSMGYIWRWEPARGCKSIIVPAGTSNGIVIKNRSAIASATVDINIELTETSDS